MDVPFRYDQLMIETITIFLKENLLIPRTETESRNCSTTSLIRLYVEMKVRVLELCTCKKTQLKLFNSKADTI